MKRFKKHLAALVSASFMTALILNFNACTEQSPLQPGDNETDVSNAMLAKVVKDKTKAPRFVKLKGGYSKNSTDEPSPNVLKSVTKYVTYKDGGVIVLGHKAPDNNDPFEVVTTLKVAKQTISEDAELALTMYDDLSAGNVDVTFQPHGITFSQPAMLSIEIKFADLSELPANISLYYVNSDTGQWERMNARNIIVKRDIGYIKIIDAEIPHFSRYAIGAGE